MDAALASRNGKPEDVAPKDVLRQRRNFLADQLGGELSRRELQKTYERIIAGNELQDINYLEKGMIASRSVCRIRFEAMGGGYATGFLISPRVLITNNHVFPDAQTARTAEAQFGYERAVRRTRTNACAVQAGAGAPVLHVQEARLQRRGGERARCHRRNGARRSFGFLPLIDVTGKVAEGEWLTIVQHPAGQLKQVCVRENQLLRRTDDFLWYSTDTLSGSSGSPVFSNDWLVVALHHSGVPERRDDVIQTVLGRDFNANVDKEDDIKWIANEGVRVSRIVQTLREALPDHDLIKPIIAPQPVPPAGAVNANRSRSVGRAVHAKPQEVAMSRSVTVQLEISDAGEVRLVGGGAVEAIRRPKQASPRARATNAGTLSTRRRTGHSRENTSRATIPRSATSRCFCRGSTLPLRGMQPRCWRIDTKFELKYEHFSVVMNKERRLAFFSAATLSAARALQTHGSYRRLAG